jgi:hypothetical protein
MLLSSSSTSCNYCGSSIKWVYYEKYGASRSIDLFTEKEHECDPSNMLKTSDMSNCEHCGKMVRWEPAPELEEGTRPYEIFFSRGRAQMPVKAGLIKKGYRGAPGSGDTSRQSMTF